MIKTDKLIAFDRALYYLRYPANWSYAKSAFDSYFLLQHVNAKSVLSIRFSSHLARFTRKDLLLIHRFANTFHLHNLSLASFHELIRRDCSLRVFLSPHRLWRLFAAYFLLCSASSRNRIERAKVLRLLCRLLLPILSVDLSRRNMHPANRQTVNIIGGGRGGNLNEELSMDDGIVATINIIPECRNPDVVYLRGERIKYIENNPSILADLCRSTCYILKVKSLVFEQSSLPYLSAKIFDSGLGYGSLNGVPAACWDCFVHRCKCIKLLRTNFNLGAWADNQRPSSLPKIQANLIFGAHPAYLQFLFVKSLSLLVPIKMAPNEFIDITDSPRTFLKVFRRVYPSQVSP